jgi:hypothetical protein
MAAHVDRRGGVQGAGLADVVPVVAPRIGRELEAGVDAELLVHVAEVGADGEGGDVEPIADLAAGQAFGGEGDDLSLGGGEAVPAGRGSLAGAPHAEAYPSLAYGGSHPGRVSGGTGCLVCRQGGAQLLDRLCRAEQGGGILPGGGGFERAGPCS